MNIKSPITPLKLFVAILLIVPLLFLNEFYLHFRSHLTGEILYSVLTRNWTLVFLNIFLFTSFLVPLSYRRKMDWSERSMIYAFFVSLFVEMYGIPFTILFASNFFASEMAVPNTVYSFSLLGTYIGMGVPMLYSSLVIGFGALLILIGWITLYKNIKKDGIVKNGIYAQSRHPQYLGFIMIVVGWFIGWPTFLTLVMTPILVWKYVSVSKEEESELKRTKNRRIYIEYSKDTPFLL